MAGLNLLAQISDRIIPDSVLNCVLSHAKSASLLASGFTHYQDLSYQILQLEDLGLPQQGILPISAKNNNYIWPQMFV